MDCIFCAIVQGRAGSRLLYEDATCVAFLDVNPATVGHTLVVPKRHAEDLLSLTEVEAGAVMAAARRIAGLLQDRLQPAGLNLVQANGAAAWQTVFHFHLHVVPRYAADELREPWQAQPADPVDLDATQRLLLG